MSDETRGHAIRSRRLALGIKSLRKFADETKIDREALSKAEDGTGSVQTYERAEAWLDRAERETGHDVPAVDPLRFTLHDVYGVGEIIAEGGTPDSIVEAVEKVLRSLRKFGEDRPE